MLRLRDRLAMSAGTLTAAALSILVLGAGAATAEPAKTHRFTMHTRLVFLDSKTLVGSYTAPGAGRWGSEINRITSIEGSTVSGKSTNYERDGATYSDFTITASPQADGSVGYAGKGPITGGSGRYEGARGRWNGSCTQAKDDPVIRCTNRVRVTY